MKHIIVLMPDSCMGNISETIQRIIGQLEILTFSASACVVLIMDKVSIIITSYNYGRFWNKRLTRLYNSPTLIE